MHWGIRVPNSLDDNIYVWLDALCNYLTILDYGQNQQKEEGYFSNFIHVIGKDIVKFHAIYWPAFLLGLRLPLPGKIIVHDHWILQGKKMSKSLGNVIDPFLLLQTYPLEAIRLYFLTEGPEYYGVEFSVSLLVKRYNEFIEKFINIITRIINRKVFPSTLSSSLSSSTSSSSSSSAICPEDQLILLKCEEIGKQARISLNDYQIRKGYLKLSEIFDILNKFIAENKIWNLNENDKTEKIGVILEIISQIAVLLYPFLPNYSNQIMDILGKKIHEEKNGWKRWEIDEIGMVKVDQVKNLFRKKL